MKGKRLGELQDIDHEKFTYVTNIIRGKGGKGLMGNPKGILQVLWERGFMDMSKDVFTYYKLCIREDKYGNIILEKNLR